MTTSGTNDFGYSLENFEIMREAFERCGKDMSMITAVQVNSAARSIDLMFTDWVNKGINLFAVDRQEIPLFQGVPSYTIPVDTARVLQVLIQGQIGTTQEQNLIITAISRAEYFALPQPLQQGERPTEYYLERTANPIMYFWPVPQSDTYRAIYYRLRMSQDVGKPTDTPDVSNRWLEAICAGLAARLAVKYAPDKLAMLGPLADAAFQTAAQEDVEHVTFRIQPDNSCYYD